MVVTATCADGTTREITDYIYTMEGNNIIITYSTFTTTLAITFIECTAISVTTQPKLTYNEGEEFDPTGMIVTASYSDGTKKEVTNYNYSVEDTIVTITYVEGTKTYTTTLEINFSVDVESLLTDFTYTDNSDGTYTITGWNQTLNGESSTEFIVPDSDKIIL